MTTATDERWQQIKDVFDGALERTADDRAAFLARSCGDDAGLRARVEELLRAHEIDDGFIEQPAAGRLGWAAETTGREWIGRTIGAYRVVEVAGHGGLSQVFRAVREGAEYEQQVAIKLLRPGFGGDALLRRFRAERRMLAGLSHPNIAHFLDGGATDEGAPYLVMEFVEGRPIYEYCDERGLGLGARLDLFRTLCGAVQYVHQHLMVHGDLKGANVLVTAAGVVKLLDFGVAQLLTPDEAAGGSTRAPTLLLLTPEYASPEQLRGEAITTASDVYSLGALLYRLLAGAPPYAGVGAGPLAVAEQMAGGAPVPPSVAAGRTDGRHAAFARELRGDLDTIALKALKVDPAERYASALALADDLHRWLRGFPVDARPDSVGYRVRKWARRHRAAAVLSALAVVALVGGIAATTWQAHAARLERARAERNFAAVRELSAVFLADVYQAIAKIPGSTEARKLLVDNTLKYLQALEQDARDSPELRRDLGMAYERLADVQGANVDASLGDKAAANASYRRSLEIRERLAREQPSLQHRSELLRAQVNLTESLLDTGDLAGAQAVAAAMLPIADQVDADAGATMGDRRHVGAAYLTQGWMEWSAGHVDAGLKSLGRAHEVYARNAREYPQERITQRDLALIAGRLGEAHGKGTRRLEEAIGYYREAIATIEPLLRADPDNAGLSRMLLYSRASVAELHNYLRQPREALAELERILPQFRRMRADDPADKTAPFALAAVLNMAGESRLQLGEYEAARRLFEESDGLVDRKAAATVADLQLLAGQVHAGLARAHAGAARRAEGAVRGAEMRSAAEQARRAYVLLEPLAASGQLERDARWAIDATRAALAGS